jgi:hypothetical protein
MRKNKRKPPTAPFACKCGNEIKHVELHLRDMAN